MFNETFLCFDWEDSTTVHLMATGGGGGGGGGGGATYNYPGIWSNLVRSLRLRIDLWGLRT